MNFPGGPANLQSLRLKVQTKPREHFTVPRFERVTLSADNP